MNIVEKIGMPAALGQLAEEAAELAQAALKMQRILMGTNPTPVTPEEAKSNLIEEAVDVDLCLTVLGYEDPDIHYSRDLYEEKRERWEKRITEAQTVCDEDGCRIVYPEVKK